MQLRRSRRRMHGNSGRGYLPKIKSNSRNMCASNLTNAHRLIHTRSGQPALVSYGKTRSLRDPASSALYSQLPMSPNGVRREKAALSSGCKSHPATAPAGSNRSSYGGNEVAEAFGKRVTKYGDSASV